MKAAALDLPGAARIAVPALLTVGLVAGYVAVAGFNRSSADPVTLVLTERELPLAVPRGAGDDRTPVVQLRIDFDRGGDPLESRNWLTEDRLRSLGFALDMPPGAPEALEHYTRIPPRLGWVVLEYDGPAWREAERRHALRRETDPWRGPVERSRLVPVDAGPELEPLLARYPANHLILRAVFRLTFTDVRQGGPFLSGTVTDLIPAAVTVPYDLVPVVDALPPDVRSDPTPGPHQPAAPRYEAELAVGKLGIPYLRGLRVIG